MKLGLVQMSVCEDKNVNLKTAEQAVETLASQGADLVVLPEMFCCLYENSAFVKNAESDSGCVTKALSEMARKNHVYLVGGSMPESDGGKLYNTSFVFDESGARIARHRKAHLFDIDVPGGQFFRESDTFTAGDEVTVFETKYGKIGLCICFDMRFPELARKMVQQGAQLILCPAAFNNTTGPAHWEIMHRARAVDNQVFVAAAAPASDETAPYISYGHSMAVSPWGEILAQAGRGAENLLVELDFAKNDEIRTSLPLLSGLRPELY